MAWHGMAWHGESLMGHVATQHGRWALSTPSVRGATGCQSRVERPPPSAVSTPDSLTRHATCRLAPDWAVVHPRQPSPSRRPRQREVSLWPPVASCCLRRLSGLTPTGTRCSPRGRLPLRGSRPSAFAPRVPLAARQMAIRGAWRAPPSSMRVVAAPPSPPWLRSGTCALLVRWNARWSAPRRPRRRRQLAHPPPSSTPTLSWSFHRLRPHRTRSPR